MQSEVKVSEVTKLFKRNNISDITINEIEVYTNKAFEVLETLSITSDKKAILKNFGLSLMKRKI